MSICPTTPTARTTSIRMVPHNSHVYHHPSVMIISPLFAERSTTQLSVSESFARLSRLHGYLKVSWSHNYNNIAARKQSAQWQGLNNRPPLIDYCDTRVCVHCSMQWYCDTYSSWWLAKWLIEVLCCRIYCTLAPILWPNLLVLSSRPPIG